MDLVEPFADDRLVANCVHCAAGTETRDHCPSRMLLDKPYPENLPFLPSCTSCNRGFSLDEEYFACLRACPQTSPLSPSRFDRSQDPLAPSTHDPASTSGHPTLRTRPRAVPEGAQPHEGGGRVLRRPPQPPMWSPLGRKRDLGAGGFVDTLLSNAHGQAP